ncbi:hypothetical protein PG991_007614 [Apiospora marii]|uniref:Secreted protein n=1 Tax=Apiospora marii TaxID=335849 RepID=A0ABR1RV66_9PEZI
MFTKTVNLALIWVLLCGVLAALLVDAAALPSSPSGHSDLVKTGNGQGESRGILFKLAIEEGGPIMEFNGTLQVKEPPTSVEKQIQAIKPDFKFTPVHKPYTASPKQLDENIDYLRGLGDALCGDHGGSDGKNCGQIACQWNGAIKWCNMGAEYYQTKCSDFADYADDILHGCKHAWTTAADYIHGQEEDKTYDHDFLVVVEASKC